MLRRGILLIVLLRFVMGGFWFEHSYQKWGWFESGELHERLLRYNETSKGLQKVYLERFCIPFWKLLQALVVFGELAVALSFLAGYWTRAASWGAAFMAISFIFAQGRLLTWELIGNPYGPVTIMATFVAAYAGGEERLSIRPLLQRR